MGRAFARAAAEAWRHLVRAWRTSVLALAAIVSAVLVLGVFLVVSRAIDAMTAEWAKAAEVSVFLRDDVSADARARLEAALRGDAAVSSVRLVTEDEARRRFVERFPDLAPLLDEAGDAPLPLSFDVLLASGATDQQVSALLARVRREPEVADIRADRELVASIGTSLRVARFVGGTLSFVLIVAAGLAIVSVVRLSYLGRRDEVDLMYLLGTPTAAIRGPFVIEGSIQGGLGAILGLALLAIAYRLVVHHYATSVGALLHDRTPLFLPWSLLLALLLGATAIGAIAGLVAVIGRRGAALE